MTEPEAKILIEIDKIRRSEDIHVYSVFMDRVREDYNKLCRGEVIVSADNVVLTEIRTPLYAVTACYTLIENFWTRRN